MTHWRLIDTGPLDAAANMAVDEALLACFDPATSQPVLRLYGWSPPALSLGRYQDAATALDLPRCAADDVAVVRRMTGGGIIYHADELTYSIVCRPDQVGEGAGVKAGFRRLCGFLLGAYRKLGLNPSFAIDHNPEGAQLGVRTSFCFAGKEECDIVVQGRKLGGNAQRRARGLILQHGSIPLQSRVPLGLTYVTDSSPGAERAASLAELGVETEPDRLKTLLREAFEETLGVRLTPVSLSPQEADAVERLTREKYRATRWNIEGIDR
ncbi:lipoate--protein ligase family protein [Geomesophilobacter sediminis]|uniref:Lipoate--protein ligase family protein n=1 Tax=Geomesophilobacter sediminis TaxID=2798584 RepID=A0A8J7JDL2_9BACT|nr:biotin/lipoate A/B protein ligase family protein [Geomesophilobacter sediminis]MBJ6725391.1 lipoate--protein ligase family protein [Geomesophilobacter sediminis]